MKPIYHYARLVAVLLTLLAGASASYLLHSAEPDRQRNDYPDTSPPHAAQDPDAKPLGWLQHPPIAYRRLSDESTAPFIMFGGRVPVDHPEYSDYAKSIRRFPGIKSCLKTPETKNARPDISQFDWDKMRSRTDAEVCLFRVFTSIGAIEDSRRWLQSQGFSLESTKEVDPELFYTREQGIPGWAVNANWSIEESGRKFKSSETTMPFMRPYSFTISVRWTENIDVDTVRIVFNTL